MSSTSIDGLSVTPHAGLRPAPSTSTITIVAGEGIIADYDADSMDLFSFTVDVTFAKECTDDAWTVKPSLNLTLTDNFSDDYIDNTVHMAGVENLCTNEYSKVIVNLT